LIYQNIYNLISFRLPFHICLGNFVRNLINMDYYSQQL